MFKNTTGLFIVCVFLTGILYAYDPVPLAHKKKIYTEPKTGNIFMHKTTGYLHFTKSSGGKNDVIRMSGNNKTAKKIEFIDDGEYEVILLKKKVVTRRKKRSRKRYKKTIRKEIMRFSMFIDSTKPTSFLKYDNKYNLIGKSPVFGKPTHITLNGNDKGKSAQSGVESYYYSVNSADYQKYVKPVLIPKEGTYEFRFYAVDHVGNAEKPNRIVLIVDQTPPASTLVFDRFSHENKFFSLLSKIGIRASDNGAGTKNIFYKWPGKKYQKYTGKIGFNNVSERTSTLSYYAVDRVGNKEVERTFSFTLDKIKPTLRLTPDGSSFKDGKILYITLDTRFKLESTDRQSGVRNIFYNYNHDTNWSVYYEPFSVKETLKHQKINYWVSDNVHNKTETMNLDVIIDNDLPTASLKIDTEYYKIDQTYFIGGKTEIDLITSDKTSGVKHFEYSLDEQPYISDEPVVIHQAGRHTLKIKVTDNVDIENSVVFDIVVDSGKPSIGYNFGIVSDKKEDWNAVSVAVYPKNTIIYLNATDKESGVGNIYFTINGNNKNTYDSPIIMEDAGNYHMKIYAKDKVGNVSSIEEFKFIVQ